MKNLALFCVIMAMIISTIATFRMHWYAGSLLLSFWLIVYGISAYHVKDDD